MARAASQRSPIELPNKSWISRWELSRAIAAAYFPHYREASGVDLITCTTQTSGPAEGLPLVLSDERRAILQALSAKLPPLRMDEDPSTRHRHVSDSAWAAFAEAFTRLCPTVGWLPCRPSANDLYAGTEAGLTIADEHLRELTKRMVSADPDKAISAASANRVTVREMAADTSFSLESLQRYFKDQKIPFVLAKAQTKFVQTADLLEPELVPIERDVARSTVDLGARSDAPALHLELTPVEQSARPVRDDYRGPTPPGNGRTQRRFSDEQLIAFELQKKMTVGLTWARLAAELGMTKDALSGQIFKHRQRQAKKKAKQVGATGAFGQLAESVAGAKSQSKR